MTYPRTWIDVLVRENKDRILIGFGVAILLISLVLGFLWRVLSA